MTLVLSLCAAVLDARQADAPAYETLFYDSGGLHLEAYFYKPEGKGPFPLVVYNHGSRPGEERIEWAVPFIARILLPAGYAVLAPERRGYGKSDGPTFSEEIGADRGERFVSRVAAEANDVSAAVEYAKARLPIDPRRIAMIGYSFGGIVTTLAAGTSTSLVAVVSQAPGALNWDRSAALRESLVASAAKIRVPMLCMVAENDATTESARTICATAKSHGGEAEVIVYPPFTHPRARNAAAPGHALFSPLGVEVWRNDVLGFLAKHQR